MTRIAVGCDHVALTLKDAVVAHLRQRGIETLDYGTYSSETVVDYPDYAQKVARAVASGEVDGGVVICGTGLGVSIAANKVQGVRAALCHDIYTAHQASAHNDANVLAMGAYIVSTQRMPGIVDEWLDTPFENGRHTARVRILDRYLENPARGRLLADAKFPFAAAISLRGTSFGPVLFSGRVEEGFASFARAGFRHVEISVRHPEDIDEFQVPQLLQKYSLTVSALATGQGCIHDQLCFTNLDPDMSQAAVQRFKKIIRAAAGLGGARVIFGGVRGQLSSVSGERARQVEQVMASLGECDRYAAEQGVQLLLEPVNRYETNFINNAAEGLQFLDRIGTRATSLLLDTFHMNIEEVDINASLRMTGARLGYLHMVDSNRQSPGQGHLDFASIFTTLMEIGYSGPVSAEILPLPDDESAVVRTRNFLDALGAKFN